MADGGEVRLGRDGVGWGWTYAALSGLAGAAVVALGFALGSPQSIGYPAILFLGMSASLVVLLTRLGDGHVVLRDDVIELRIGRTERTWAWSDVLEVGVGGSGQMSMFLVPGCTVVVRPDGGRWETPGPNQPFTTTLPVFGVRAQRRVRRALRAACEAHGVPYSDDGLKIAGMPRPGSVLRRDAAKDPGEPGGREP